MAGALHRQDLKFFSFYVNELEGEQMQELIEVHRSDGFLFWMQLKSLIYTRSCFLVWSNTTRRNFYQKYGYVNQDEKVEAIFKTLFDTKLLNKDLFDKYGVLTSADLQSLYLLCTPERTKVIFIEEYLLIDFVDYKYLNQIIHIYKRDNETGSWDETKLVERFRKKSGQKIEPESGKVLKGTVKTTGKSSVSPSKPLGNHPVKPEKNKAVYYKPYTHQQVLELIKVAYNDQTDNFQTAYTQDEFEAYVMLNKKINDRYLNIRKSDRQLTLPEFIEFTEAYGASVKDLENACKKISKKAIAADTEIFKLISDCLEVAEKAKPHQEPVVPEADEVEVEEVEENPYVRDEQFEKSMAEFFGFGSLGHDHPQHVAIEQFCRVQHYKGRLSEFQHQFKYYIEYKKLKGLEFKHKLKNFIGQEKFRFENGEWDSENWESKLKEEQQGKAKNNNKVTQSKSEQAQESHNSWLDIIKGGNK